MMVRYSGESLSQQRASAAHLIEHTATKAEFGGKVRCLPNGVAGTEKSQICAGFGARIYIELIAPGSSPLRHIDDKAKTEGGEGGFDLFHLRRVPQIEHTVDLCQMPPQPPCQFGAADSLLAHRIVKRGLGHPKCRQ